MRPPCIYYILFLGLFCYIVIPFVVS
jgi:hypothetical protein